MPSRNILKRRIQIHTEGTTAIDSLKEKKSKRLWREPPTPKLAAISDKPQPSSFKTPKSPYKIRCLTERPAWIPSMKQPHSRVQKLKVKPLEVCEAKLLSSTEVYSSKVIYVDGTPYIKLEKPAIHLDKSPSEMLSSRSFDQAHSVRLLSSDEGNEGIQDYSLSSKIH